MRKLGVLGLCLACLAFTSCGGDNSSESSEGGASGPTASEVVAAVQAQVPQAEEPVTITEDNDPNDLIGRPGQYVTAASLHDSRIECGPADLDVSCGAKVEEFATTGDAKNRRDYIADVTEGVGFLAEYDYLRGKVLLRVSGDLKPSEAEEYEAALSSLG